MHKVDLVPRESVTSCSARQRSVGSTERRLSSRLGVSFKLRVILTQKPQPLRQNVPRAQVSFRLLRLLLLNPLIGARLEQVQGKSHTVEHLVMESSDIQLGSQLLLSSIPEFADFELAELVAESLRGPRDITVGLGLDSGFIHSAGLAKEVHYLIARPSFRMDSGVHYQAHSPEEFGRKTAVVGNGVVVETHFFAELLGIKRPAFAIGVETQTMESEFGQAAQLLLHRELQVMSGDAFVVRDRFVVDQRALLELGCRHHDAARTLAIRSTGYVVSSSGRLKGRDRFDANGRLRKESEELRKLGFHLRDISAEIVEDLLRRGRNVLGIGLQRGAE